MCVCFILIENQLFMRTHLGCVPTGGCRLYKFDTILFYMGRQGGGSDAYFGGGKGEAAMLNLGRRGGGSDAYFGEARGRPMWKVVPRPGSDQLT